MHSAGGNDHPLRACMVGELLACFAKLGVLGFGGPIALTGAMQSDLVDRKNWISRQE